MEPTGSMTVARAGQGSVLLENREVLVAGGASSTGVTATAELYNPSTEHVYVDFKEDHLC